MKIADAHAQTLPRFNSLDEAERALFRRRDDLLARLKHATSNSGKDCLDGSAQSLKELELWYFAVLEGAGFGSLTMSQEDVEQAISIYLGEVLVKKATGFKWLVAEFAFAHGCYEIGVGTDNVKIMLSLGAKLQSKPNNKRRQSLWQEFQQFAAYAAADRA